MLDPDHPPNHDSHAVIGAINLSRFITSTARSMPVHLLMRLFVSELFPAYRRRVMGKRAHPSLGSPSARQVSHVMMP